MKYVIMMNYLKKIQNYAINTDMQKEFLSHIKFTITKIQYK